MQFEKCYTKGIENKNSEKYFSSLDEPRPGQKSYIWRNLAYKESKRMNQGVACVESHQNDIPRYANILTFLEESGEDILQNTRYEDKFLNRDDTIKKLKISADIC